MAISPLIAAAAIAIIAAFSFSFRFFADFDAAPLR